MFLMHVVMNDCQVASYYFASSGGDSENEKLWIEVAKQMAISDGVISVADKDKVNIRFSSHVQSEY